MKRNISIDVFRGLTMFLMIWVNDFWRLKDIPKWLQHAAAGEDYLGFSDLIFPWFLFVLGMSIPFAVESRINKGEKKFEILKHIFLRAIALIIMGLFHMNFEMYNHEISILPKSIFVIISTTAFFMIWNESNKNGLNNKINPILLPIIGSIILCIMFLIYQGANNDGVTIGFGIYWWGILGLIGWVYLVASSVYLFFRKSIMVAFIMLILNIIINFVLHLNLPFKLYLITGTGSLQSFAFAGIIISLLLMDKKYSNNISSLYKKILLFGVITLVSGVLFNNYFIINKPFATLPWTLISLSSGLFLFTFLHWIVQVKNKVNWYNPIKIAGTATLTCYLIPYFYYNIIQIIGFELPYILNTGFIGLMKSVIYTFIIIGISLVINKKSINIKI